MLVSFLSWKKYSWSYPFSPKCNLGQAYESKSHTDEVHAMTSEYSGFAASVAVTIPLSPCWNLSDYLPWTSAGRTYHWIRQFTWLRGTVLSDDIWCSLHLSKQWNLFTEFFSDKLFLALCEVSFHVIHTDWMLVYQKSSAPNTRDSAFNVPYCLDSALFGEFMHPFSFLPLISFGKCVMMWHR